MKNTSVILLLVAVTYAFPGHEHERQVIGDQPAKKHSLCHTVQLIDEGNDAVTKSCLGSIVDKEWVLTSAECVIEKNLEDVVVLPNQPPHTVDHWQLRHKPDSIRIHDQFDRNTGKNDVALVHLATPIDFSENVRPVKLGKLDHAKGTTLQAIKLNEETEGGLRSGKPTSSRPSTLSLTLTTLDRCPPPLHNRANLDEGTQLCAKPSKRSNLCGLDSGAPLIDEKTGEQVGIVGGAGGHNSLCHLSDDYPLLCTKVEAVKDFISETIKIPQ